MDKQKIIDLCLENIEVFKECINIHCDICYYKENSDLCIKYKTDDGNTIVGVNMFYEIKNGGTYDVVLFSDILKFYNLNKL